MAGYKSNELARFLAQRNWRQNKLAKQANIQEATISKIIKQAFYPSEAVRAAISTALNIQEEQIWPTVTD